MTLSNLNPQSNSSVGTGVAFLRGLFHS